MPPRLEPVDYDPFGPSGYFPEFKLAQHEGFSPALRTTSNGDMWNVVDANGAPVRDPNAASGGIQNLSNFMQRQDAENAINRLQGLPPQRSYFPKFDAAALEIDPLSGNPQLTDVQQAPQWMKRMTGVGDERHQSWPERLVRSATTLAGDVVEGKISTERDPVTGHFDPELIGRTMDVAGLPGGAPLAAARGTGTLGAGAMRQGTEAVMKSDTGKPGVAIAALGKTDKPFYSAVENAVRDASQQSMTPEQWRGYLSNRPGVKAEELDWIGMPEGKKVTKQQMLDHIDEHGVQVKEVEKKQEKQENQLSEDEYYSELDRRAHTALLADYPKRRGENFNQHLDRTQNVRDHYMEAAADEMAQEGILHPDDTPKGAAKFGPETSPDLSLPGGENYREKLFTLPEKAREVTKTYWAPPVEGRPEGFGGAFKSEAEARHFMKNFGIEGDPRVIESAEHAPPNEGNYIFSHWDEPNVLAHVRMNDRDVPGVGKTLHLEELQSDWHQAGRKQGYSDTTRTPTPEMEKEIDAIWARSGAPNLTARNWGSGYNPPQVAKKMLDEGRMTQADYDFLTKYADDLSASNKYARVPDAPFKTTWPDLVLKRMIREAAENGYDAVSWTPGEAQAARYDLSKQVDKVIWSPKTKSLEAFKGERSVVREDNVPSEKLINYIGKEAADKIVNNPTEKTDAYHKLTGDGLKVGGEGMKGFYDKILVDKANALAKKFGGKVEWKELSGEAGGRILGKDGVSIENAPKVPVLRLTPQMRDTALRKGFPLFSAGVPFPLQPVDHDPFKDIRQILKEQDVGGGVGAHPLSPFASDRLEQEMNQYITKRKEDAP